MSQLLRIEARTLFEQLREGEVGPVVRQTGQAAQGLQIGHRLEPAAYVRTVLAAPGLQREQEVEIPQREEVEQSVQLARLAGLCEGEEGGGRGGGGGARGSPPPR